MSFFDLRRLQPREKRRKSQREVEKGVTGCEAGKRRSCAEDAKRARRRLARKAGMDLARHLIQSNPSGSKLVRRFAETAGFGIQEGAKARKPTAKEARRWYKGLEQAPFLRGSKSDHLLRRMKPTLAQHVADAVRVMG